MNAKLEEPFVHVSVYCDGEGCWPDLVQRPEAVIEARLTSVARLPHGMASGKSSVTIRIDLPDGRVVLAQTSLAILDAAARIFVGAEQQQAAQLAGAAAPAPGNPTKH